MEVILKKTKITKSIVNQSLTGSYSLFLSWNNYDILGWCLMDGKYKVRYILLYNRVKQTVVKLPYINNNDYEITSRNEQLEGESRGCYRFPIVYRLQASFSDFNGRYTSLIWSEEEKEVVEAKQVLTDFLREVNQKGQIYL